MLYVYKGEHTLSPVRERDKERERGKERERVRKRERMSREY
jgi:hypothetical protein